MIDSLVQRIHALEKTVTEKITILTPYDARVCVEVEEQCYLKCYAETLTSRAHQLTLALFV